MNKVKVGQIRAYMGESETILFEIEALKLYDIMIYIFYSTVYKPSRINLSRSSIVFNKSVIYKGDVELFKIVYSKGS